MMTITILSLVKEKPLHSIRRNDFTGEGRPMNVNTEGVNHR